MILGNRVFVSSTCYDLIDLRAHVEHSLRDMGMAPVLSDAATSDFTVVPGENSIETCLVNVASCDHIVVILSQRYGPTLEKYGHPHLSATHLEYQQAVKGQKPIYFYVRDRLLAEYQIWKKNPESRNNYVWCQKADDAENLFKLIKEHEAPPEREASCNKQGVFRNNWIKTFQSSIDLIRTIRKDLAAPAGAAVVRDLAEKGQLPEIRITVHLRQAPQNGQIHFQLLFTNHGTVAALEPRIRLRQEHQRNSEFRGLNQPIDPGKSAIFSFDAKLVGTGLFAIIDIEYHARGWRIMETFTLDKDFRYGYQGKTPVESGNIICQLPEDPWQQSRTES